VNQKEGKLLIEQKVNDFQKNEKMYLDKAFQGKENNHEYSN
jgi:hypothetical protein